MLKNKQLIYKVNKYKQNIRVKVKIIKKMTKKL